MQMRLVTTGIVLLIWCIGLVLGWQREVMKGILLLIASIASLLVLRWLIIQARRRTSRTTGTVVRVEIRGSPFTWGPPFIWEPSPDIEFVDGQGNKHLCKSSYWTTWNQWPVGSQVDVTYDPHDLRIVNLNCPEA